MKKSELPSLRLMDAAPGTEKSQAINSTGVTSGKKEAFSRSRAAGHAVGLSYRAAGGDNISYIYQKLSLLTQNQPPFRKSCSSRKLY